MSHDIQKEIAEELLAEETGQVRNKRVIDRTVIRVLAIGWALFQLALPSLIILDSVTVRAVHLAFAIALVFLTIPVSRHNGRIKFFHSVDHIPLLDYLLAAVGIAAALYIVMDWEGISMRAGRPIEQDIIFALTLIVLVLEAARRSIGIALPIIAIVFTVYAFLGPHMPGILAFKGVSLTKYLNQICLSTEGIFGIPLDVSANTVFLFVLLGSMLERFGAGQFFNDLALSLLGKYKGGPAKAAVVSSGLTGLISGSSIANVVTTGTFTIPMMKKVGYPGKIAAATEVAASTNGQLMPPIMGAAAFIIAEYLGLPYLDVVKAAAVPAFISYFALFYITHLEASKRGMSGIPEVDLPRLKEVLKKGFYFLIPLLMLIVELMVMRHSPKLAAFNGILTLIVIVIVREILKGRKKSIAPAVMLRKSFSMIAEGLAAGARNMLSVALATATAGIVVGIVSLGIGSMVVQIVEVLSGGNFILLLVITAIASLILGMGLPTTATYIVMASITVPVIVTLAQQSGINAFPPIAAHLFCFYFGILADDTPPVGLAAYTAAAIAKSDPIATGVQGFIYDLRTAVIPFMFIFNPELLLYGVDNFFQGILIFIMGVFGTFAFTNAVQGWFITKNRWFEVPLFLTASLILFWPSSVTQLFGLDHGARYYIYFIGLALYGLTFLIQKIRLGSEKPLFVDQ